MAARTTGRNGSAPVVRHIAASKLGNTKLADEALAQWMAKRSDKDVASLRKLLPKSLHSFVK